MKLTKEDILLIAQQKMDTLLSKYHTIDRTLLIEFWSEANEINSWITEKLRRLKNDL